MLHSGLQARHLTPSSIFVILKFKRAHLKFSVYGRKQTDRQTDIHTHTRVQCSHASVGLAQAHPNYCGHLNFNHPNTPVIRMCWTKLCQPFLATLEGSLCLLHSSWKHRITSIDKADFATKVKVTVKSTHWVLYAQKTERILALATYAVLKSSILGPVSRVYTTHQWQQQVSHSVLALQLAHMYSLCRMD